MMTSCFDDFFRLNFDKNVPWPHSTISQISAGGGTVFGEAKMTYSLNKGRFLAFSGIKRIYSAFLR